VPEAGRTVAEQSEAVYRDINRMVDTLGVNARHLKEYILGHMGKLRDPHTHQRKTKEDLEIPDDWVLCDAEDVGDILGLELRGELEGGRVKDLDATMDACKELSKALARLRIKEMDLKKNIAARVDSEQASALRSLPLSAEQAAQQADLRKQFTTFSKLLVEAEESLTLLRARMATAGVGLEAGAGKKSLSGGSGSVGNGHATSQPSMEQVMRTIMKMTSMVEKRSGDVDVLENQLRKLRLQGSISPGGGPGSRDNSPFTTPQKRLSRSIFSPGGSQLFASSVASYNGSPGPLGSTPRKKLSGYTEPEKAQIRDRMQKRGAAISRLRDSVEKAGPNVWRMTDDD
jgi:nucleoporin NUP159